MHFEDIRWEELFANRAPHSPQHRKAKPGSKESQAQWDAKAPSFAHKPTRSDYISQLQRALALNAGETVFDMGCGSGTLAIPLAEEGHQVVAVDFSPKMLEELRSAASQRGVQERITVVQRSWQQELGDLPVCDVAVSSRSFVVDDMVDGLLKLEAHARRRCFLSTGAGDIPYRDHRIYEAMGRTQDVRLAPVELGCILNWLLVNGRFPELSYITFPGKWRRKSREELTESIWESHAPQSAEEERLLSAFISEHAVEAEDGTWGMDYAREDRWALISWEPPQR